MSYLESIDIAERVAQAGISLALQPSPEACTDLLIERVRSIRGIKDVVFIDVGCDTRHATGDAATFAAAMGGFSALTPCEVDVDGVEFYAVPVADSLDPESWSGWLFSRLAEPDVDTHRALWILARQAGVAITLIRQRERLVRHERQQAALVEAGKALNQELNLETVLVRIAELATKLVGARYAALGVLDESGEHLAQFHTVGIDEETRSRIGDLPTGKGVLGVLIRDPRPLRMADISHHASSVGFPEHHPPMGSFLGVPITSRSNIKGRLYLTEKIGAAEFSIDDEELAKTLASQAGIAIENAELYEAQRQLAAQLAEANEHKSSFLSNVSHELRSPLNTVIGYTDLLLLDGDNLTEEQLEDIRVISSSSRHLLSLIADLLDFGRIEAGKLELDLELLDGIELVRDVASAVRTQLAPGVKLIIEGDSPIALTADRRRLRQMLLNVLGNAAKFTEQGSITINVSPHEDDIRFAVTDTGGGIPDDDLGRLFESFFQSRAAIARTPRPHEGAGLGLAITQLLAQAHGGVVTIMSEVGTGTTVSIQIPREPASEVEHEGHDR